MERDFRQGSLQIDFPVEKFDSVAGLLWRSLRLFGSTLPFLVAVTLIVHLPGKALVQYVCDAAGVDREGVASYLVMSLADLVFSALVAPAAIYGLVTKLRTGTTGSLGEAFRWGRRQYGKMLWTKIKVEITITLWTALLVIPGVVAMVRLFFTDAIVAVEGDRTSEVLVRSRELSAGYGWRVFWTMLTMLPVSVVQMYASLRSLQISRLLFVPVDSLAAVGDLWMTVVSLLIYLGLTAPVRVSYQGSRGKS